MFNLIYYLLFLHCPDCSGNQGLVALLSESDQLPGSQSLKLVLDLAEGEFYWVILGAVGDVIDPAELQISHDLLGII